MKSVKWQKEKKESESCWGHEEQEVYTSPRGEFTHIPLDLKLASA